jgi:hypothetical protein
MDSERVIDEAAERFKLEQRLCGPDDVWGWCRRRTPGLCFVERGRA